MDAVKLSEREEADQLGAETARRAEMKLELAKKMSLVDGGKRPVNGNRELITNGVETDEQGDIIMG